MNTRLMTTIIILRRTVPQLTSSSSSIQSPSSMRAAMFPSRKSLIHPTLWSVGKMRAIGGFSSLPVSMYFLAFPDYCTSATSLPFACLSSRGPPALVPPTSCTWSATHFAGCDPLRQSPTASLPFSPSARHYSEHFQAPPTPFKKEGDFSYSWRPSFSKSNTSPPSRPTQNATRRPTTTPLALSVPPPTH